MEEEKSSRREEECSLNLERLIKIDCKESNFTYKDQFRNLQFKVHYPHFLIDRSHSEGNLMKIFWKLIQTHYFKKIENQQLNKLEYIQNLFSSAIQSEDSTPNIQNLSSWLNKMPYSNQYKFWADILETIDLKYLKNIGSGKNISLSFQNWFKSMFFQWKKINISSEKYQKIETKTKKIFSKLKEHRKNLMKKKDKKLKQLMIKEEENFLNEILESLKIKQKGSKIEEQQSENQIDGELKRLQQQLGEISVNNTSILNSIQQKIFKQCQREGYLDDSNALIRARTSDNQIEENDSNNKIVISDELNCIEYAIRCLEEKQIAESVSKIISSERANGQNKFLITFQTALNIDPKLITEDQLEKINCLREFSLLKFYKTGVKSLYSYTCQNYAGFQELMENRTNLFKIKNKDFLQAMKKGSYLSKLEETQNNMADFDTCHHCKYFYPTYMLECCKFASEKQAFPKITTQMSENDVELQNQVQRSRISYRFLTKKRNCLSSYAKINDVYVCGRKYCKSCLKDNYDGLSINQDGACPFCQNECTCTRCLRNQKITKFKNIYTAFGGDYNKIQSESLIQILQEKKSSLVSLRTRGRPVKIVRSIPTHLNSRDQLKKKLNRGEKQNNLKQNATTKKQDRKKMIFSKKQSDKSMNLGWKTEESESNHLENESSMIEKQTALYSQRGRRIVGKYI